MIYIEIIDNKPTRSTSFEQIGKNYQNVITTDYEDYTVNNRKYIFENGEVKLNPNWEEEKAQKEKQRRNQEIDSKIKELREMSLIDIMNNNKENIKIYNDVISGLELSRP